MKNIFLTPGPTQLYDSIPNYINEALETDILSLSHRSQKFKDIYKNTSDSLRKLFALPNNVKILFLTSATEAMERVIQGCVGKESFHFVNGSFSKRFLLSTIRKTKERCRRRCLTKKFVTTSFSESTR